MKEPVFFVRDPFSWWILYLILLLLLFSCVNFQCSKRINGTSGTTLKFYPLDLASLWHTQQWTQVIHPRRLTWIPQIAMFWKEILLPNHQFGYLLLVFRGQCRVFEKDGCSKKIQGFCSLQADVALQKRALAKKKWKKPTWVWSRWDENDFMDEQKLKFLK